MLPLARPDQRPGGVACQPAPGRPGRPMPRQRSGVRAHRLRAPPPQTAADVCRQKFESPLWTLCKGTRLNWGRARRWCRCSNGLHVAEQRQIGDVGAIEKVLPPRGTPVVVEHMAYVAVAVAAVKGRATNAATVGVSGAGKPPVVVTAKTRLLAQLLAQLLALGQSIAPSTW